MSAPRIAFVVAAADASSTAGVVLERLRAQTIAAELEVVLVLAAPGAAAPGHDSGLVALQVVSDTGAASPDAALAAGIRASRAPFVALLEDHAFPRPDVAERIVAAFADGWDVVGMTIASANVAPGHLARANMLVGYGSWAEPAEPGPRDELPNHNVAYRRSLLDATPGRLAADLDRWSDFHTRLRSSGASFALSSATVDHVNPSSLTGSARVRFAAGRVYGAGRARDERWTRARRLAYAGGAPLIPLVRLARLHRARRGASWPLLVPALLYVLACDAAGQAAGYLGGEGRSRATLVGAEQRRSDFVSRADRRRFGWERSGR